ncbi:MAG: hypothetical protein ACI85K_003736 [Hyphomicrobiaceae bacterium]|jgi:hypothetical protein
MKNSFQTLLLGAGFGAAFLIGQCFPRSADANQSTSSRSTGDLSTAATQPASGHDISGQAAAGTLTLDAQGRGPVNPAPRPITPADPDTSVNQTIAYTENSSSASSNNGFLAVTGSYGMGTQVLYVIDTENRQLAVYEARGGSTEQRRIVMVGARRIDLDLQLPGYNDRSEYEYGDLEKLFDKRNKKDRSVKTGLERNKR